MSRIAALGLVASLLLVCGCPGIQPFDSGTTGGQSGQNSPATTNPPGGSSASPDKSMDGTWRFASQEAGRTVCVMIQDGAVVEIDAGCDGKSEQPHFDPTLTIDGEHAEVVWYYDSDVYHYWRDALVLDRAADGSYAGTVTSVLVNHTQNVGERLERGSDAVFEREE